MADKLELIRESKLHELLPGRDATDALEASGVALLDDTTALVIFDNLNAIALIDLSLKPNERNAFISVPSLGAGFEDIAVDFDHERAFCVIEALKGADGQFRAYVMEYDKERRLRSREPLPHTLRKANKGVEGLAFLRADGTEFLYALFEGKDTTGGGGILVVERTPGGAWAKPRRVPLPASANFEDFAAMSYRSGRLAIVSQASARLWVAEVDVHAQTMVQGTDRVYRFPKRSYGNVEGIAWLSDGTLVAVSDRRKTDQKRKCAKRDQSIHLFRIPEE